jgi:4-hydroxy-3-methylbut-2-enyl diphosphate reductase
VAYVTQTTLSVADAQRIIDALKRRWPNIKGPPKEDICYATTNRQRAVSALSPEVDLVIVIGSRNSSNSKRLVETAREGGRPGYLIDDVSELRAEWFSGVEGVLVTAGASAPDHLVRGVIERLERDFGGIVETRTLVEEDVAFELPRSLRSLAVLG